MTGRIFVRGIVPGAAVAAALLAVTGAGGQTGPQTLPLDRVPLHDLSAFRASPANWLIVEEVVGSRQQTGWISTEPGQGVLVNTAPSGQGEHLLTEWKHGDLELELEFMMTKGSNSGIYLQGRYEVQLLDSWGVKEPTFADAGGIYQRWDPERGVGQEGFDGRAPRVNASFAPGLWQQLVIRFRAPRFDSRGRKTENARFIRVVHNGVVVQENVEVSGPTRSATLQGEAPAGPLVVQGDHGPVAIRNIRYKRYGLDIVRLTDLRYRFYEGQFHQLSDYLGQPPSREGVVEGVSGGVAGIPDMFALAFEGTFRAPTTGTYLIELALPWVGMRVDQNEPLIGTGRLRIGEQEVLSHAGVTPSYATTVELPAGEHPFTLEFFKNRRNSRPAMELHVQGPGVPRQALHATNALPPTTPAGAIPIDPGQTPLVLRSFVHHGDRRRTHAVSVGDPIGVHYSVDLARGALLHAWRGPFIEAMEMWHSRGDEQTAVPRGSTIALSGTPAVALLAGGSAPWPDSAQAEAPYQYRGYRIDQAGRPTFRYALGDVSVEDFIRPAADGLALQRELILRSAESIGNVYARLGEGTHVQRLPDGSYAVDDSRYYISLGPNMPQPLIRQSAGREELLLPVRFGGGEARVGYEIVW